MHENTKFRGLMAVRFSLQHGADADEDQISNRDHDGEFDHQHGDAEQYLDDVRG